MPDRSWWTSRAMVSIGGGALLGAGTWPGMVAARMMSEDVFPVCSPDFADGRLPRTLAALAAAPLLHSQTQPWDEWFRALGETAPDVLAGGPGFQRAGAAAKSGSGWVGRGAGPLGLGAAGTGSRTTGAPGAV